MAEEYRRTARDPQGMTLAELRDLVTAWEQLGTPADTLPIFRVTMKGRVRTAIITIEETP